MFINRISNSKSDTINQCLLKYSYRYISRFPGYESGNEESLNFGSYIHKIFEDGYKYNDTKDLVNLAENLKEVYHIPFRMKDRTLTCITNFIKFNSKLGETLAVELDFSIPIAEGITYTGIIDRLVRGTENGILVIDYKTSKREKTRMDLLTDGQLIGYAFAVSKLYNVPISDIVCAHYYPVSGNFVHITYNESSVRRWMDQTIARVWNIRKRKLEDFPAMENSFCNWCEYKKMCPRFAEPAEVSKCLLEQTELAKKNKKAKKGDQPTEGSGPMITG